MTDKCQDCSHDCKESSGQVKTGNDATICFCFGKSLGELKQAYHELGSLQAVEEKTRVGTACAGCKVILQSLFGESPINHYKNFLDSHEGNSLCVQPGTMTQHGFIVSDQHLETYLYSSNGVAPHLGDCDTTTSVDYVLLDQRGMVVMQDSQVLTTNETFCFDSREADLPKPFYGQFLLSYDRANYAGGRFNTYWTNEGSVTSTHENAASGRPRVFFPVLVDHDVANGPNDIYLAIINPKSKPIEYSIELRDVSSQNSVNWTSNLPGLGSTWINATKDLYKGFLSRYPNARCVLKVLSDEEDTSHTVSVYFFFHNKKLNVWNANHI